MKTSTDLETAGADRRSPRCPQGFAALAAIALVSCGAQDRGVIELSLTGPMPDTREATLLGSDRGTLRDVLQLLHSASQDPAVEGALVNLGSLEVELARAAELRDALRRLSDSGRAVHCRLGSADNVTYWVAATGCERVTIAPAGSLELVGLAAESIYLRDLLDSIGVSADVLQVGSHKGAAEFLTQDDITPETRETLEEILDDYTAILVDGIAEGRRLEPATVRDLVDQGPFSPEPAAEAGLVDAVEHRDQTLQHLRSAIPGRPELIESYGRRVRRDSVSSIVQLLAGESTRPGGIGPRVAVLYLGGPIVGDDAAGLGLGVSISAREVRRAVRQIREDAQIRAVVVRIDSPGGSALASDEIWREILRLRETRPVVASLADVAASGGYYIASAATDILAEPGTMTGSIGVIGGKVVLEDLMDRVGARAVLIRRGRNAGLASISRPFTESEREAVGAEMHAVYERFVRAVSEGRVMDEQRVRELATGRVWTGGRALDLGLVDQIGGLHEAIALAREQGELPEDAPVEAFPRTVGLFEQMETSSDPTSAMLSSDLARFLDPTHALTPALWTAVLLQHESVLALWPSFVSIR